MRAAWVALFAAAWAGCATGREPGVPPGWFGTAGPGGPGGDGYGAWVEIRTDHRGEVALSGELIVCRGDSLWVLTEHGLRPVALGRVGSVRLYREADTRGRVREVNFLLPREASIVSPREESIARARQAGLRPWARFPQGWPPGIDPAALRPKPLARP